MAKLTTYQVTEIAKDTWVINEAGMTAMFLLKGTERALLIDTGVGMTDLKKLISWLTPLPYDVVLTHGHPDHIGGAAQFEEVYIHEKDEDSLKPINYDRIADYVELLGNMGAYDVYDCSPADIRRIQKMPKCLPLKEGMVFELGGRSIEVIETPGHTSGGCCSLIGKSESCFLEMPAMVICSAETVLIHYWELWIKSSPMKVNLTAILMAMWDMRECLSLVPWIIAS